MGNLATRANRKRQDRKAPSKEILNTPVSTLTKMLVKLTLEKHATPETIHRDVFTKHLIKQYPELSDMIFTYLTDDYVAIPPLPVISIADFHEKVQEIFTVALYEDIFRVYMSTFYGNKTYITREEFQSLVKVSYNIFLDNHPDGPQVCPYEETTINSFIIGVFDSQQQIKISLLQEVTQNQCPRLINMVHCYVVDNLRFAYTQSTEHTKNDENIIHSKSSNSEISKSSMIAPSKVWILATVLPECYMYPFSKETNPEIMSRKPKHLTELGYLEYTFPTHWTLLYDSVEHGCSAEAFLKKVLNYRGPSILFLLGKRDKDFCICVSDEWHENQLDWGDKNCYLIQLSPKYHVIHKGPKIISMTMAGDNPKGIEVGTNPIEPTLSINESLTRITFNGKKFKLHSAEVWGCGLPQIKNLQTDIQTWNKQESIVNNKLNINYIKSPLEREESKSQE